MKDDEKQKNNWLRNNYSNPDYPDEHGTPNDPLLYGKIGTENEKSKLALQLLFLPAELQECCLYFS